MENGRFEIRLSKSIKKQMKQKADKIGLTPSLVVRLLINDWLAADGDSSPLRRRTLSVTRS
jgi:antitoxin component of RelBE/YafQ-DinJ toxin-antitoxin module